VLRATKNRFGGVDEIGVFRMLEEGLVPVGNPSELFLGDRARDASGSAVVATLEGTRPLLVEVQALAAKASYGAPQRVSAGIDHKRLALLLAVLEKRAGLPFGALDVFLNVVGGLRLVETAGDLAVAAALASSVYDRPVPRAPSSSASWGWAARCGPSARSSGAWPRRRGWASPPPTCRRARGRGACPTGSAWWRRKTCGRWSTASSPEPNLHWRRHG
jgi:hypothetical protein